MVSRVWRSDHLFALYCANSKLKTHTHQENVSNEKLFELIGSQLKVTEEAKSFAKSVLKHNKEQEKKLTHTYTHTTQSIAWK